MHEAFRQFRLLVFGSKKVASTVVTILGGFALVCGLVLDVPQAILKLATAGPSWIANPDLWWAVAVAVVAGAIVKKIWSLPDDLATYIAAYEEAAAISPQMGRMIVIYARFRQLQEAVAELKRGSLDREWIDGQLRLVFPQEIEFVAGKEGRERFDNLVRKATGSTKDYNIVCATIAPLMEEILFAPVQSAVSSGSKV